MAPGLLVSGELVAGGKFVTAEFSGVIGAGVAGETEGCSAAAAGAGVGVSAGATVGAGVAVMVDGVAGVSELLCGEVLVALLLGLDGAGGGGVLAPDWLSVAFFWHPVTAKKASSGTRVMVFIFFPLLISGGFCWLGEGIKLKTDPQSGGALRHGRSRHLQ